MSRRLPHLLRIECSGSVLCETQIRLQGGYLKQQRNMVSATSLSNEVSLRPSKRCHCKRKFFFVS